MEPTDSVSHIDIYEVGPRDGLQNISYRVNTQSKIDLVNNLYKAGLNNIEVTSFVHPKLVPNMADATDVFMQTSHLGDFSVLVPNQKGFDRAVKAGAKKFNIFFSPSKEFNHRNLGRKLDQVFADYTTMLEDVDKENVRAYISCAFGCPFTGKPREHDMLRITDMASELSDKIVLCDTIGTAHPTAVKFAIDKLQSNDYELALHLHNSSKNPTNIFQNVQAALDMGVTEFDSSIAGLGGCPFVPGSGSNLSTNQLLHFAERYGYETNVDIDLLRDATQMALDWKKKCGMLV